MADAVALVHRRAAERPGVTSSPSAWRTIRGPVRNMVACSVITTKSVSAGE